ncbi:Indole-3-acetaldehyde oxidase [Armadillidium vulgare]|nr:Indole-3-acetaldehyde oxidase [Armadillidium vulgare]
MTIYGKLKSKNGKLTKKEIEDSLDGNICRCTGYRPILDAFKSLAIDAPQQLINKLQDIEDSYSTLCSKTGELCKGKCHKGGEAPSECSKPKLSFNHLDKIQKTILTTEGIVWQKPTTLKELYQIISSNPNEKSLRMVLGNTGEGVYKSEAPPDVYVDISSVAELFSVAIGKPLTIGANVSIERCIDLFREVALNYEGYEYLNEIADHWAHIANLAIRKVGSWAGNLMLKHLHKEFQSDIFVTLAVAEAVINVGNAVDSSTTEISVEDLMDLDVSKSVILSMKLLPVDPNTYIRTYKISPRWVNAAAYTHAKKTEVLLTSKALSSDITIQAAIKSLGEEILPDVDPLNSSPEYRKSLSQALFYKILGLLDKP